MLPEIDKQTELLGKVGHNPVRVWALQNLGYHFISFLYFAVTMTHRP